jgi:ankyrin repeat protein
MKLHPAIEKNDVKKLRALLAAGFSPDERDKDGTTPLMKAAMFSQLDGFRALLDAGADVNAVSKNGQSVLHYAAAYGSAALVQRRSCLLYA